MTTPPLLTFRPQDSGVTLDLERLVASRLLVQANSGGGKSRLLRYLVEHLHGRVQIVILDPEGEFATLRERHDFLLAGADGDVPTDPKTAKLLARRVLELNASAIIDLYELQLHERRRYVRLFLEELVNAPRKLWRPLLVIVDEAHAFAPQTGESEAAAAVISLCTLGRKRGFAALLATQRISKLHKDAAAELNNKLIGRTGLDVDLKRAGDELGLDKDGRLALRDLAPGTFYAFGPALSATGVTLVRSGDVKTTHPQPGAIAPPAPPAPAAIKKLLGQMKDLELEAAEELRSIQDRDREIARLKTELRRAQKAQPAPQTVVDDKAIARAVADAQRGFRTQMEGARREQLFVEKQLRAQIAEIHKRLERIGRGAVQIAELAGAEIPSIEGTESAPDYSKSIPEIMPKPARAPAARASRPTRSAPAPTDSGSLPPGEHAVLTACCQYADEGCTRQQLSILTGYKRSSRDAYIQRLRTRELVEIRGDRVFAVDGAEEHLGDFEPLPTGVELQEYWLEKLPPGESAVLRILIDSYPDAVARDDISEATGYKRSSRDAYIQRLSARLLVDVSSAGVAAASLLFEP